MAGGPAEDLFEGAHGTNVNRVRGLLPRGVRENSSQRDKFPHSWRLRPKKMAAPNQQRPQVKTLTGIYGKGVGIPGKGTMEASLKLRVVKV